MSGNRELIGSVNIAAFIAGQPVPGPCERRSSDNVIAATLPSYSLRDGFQYLRQVNTFLSSSQDLIR